MLYADRTLIWAGGGRYGTDMAVSGQWEVRGCVENRTEAEARFVSPFFRAALFEKAICGTTTCGRADVLHAEDWHKGSQAS